MNKKLFFSLLFVFSLICVESAFAQCGPAVGIPCNPLDGTVSSIPDAIVIVIRYLLKIIGVITLLFIVLSGIKYVTSSGNEEKIKSAKDALYSSVLGLAIALMAYSILDIVAKILNP